MPSLDGAPKEPSLDGRDQDHGMQAAAGIMGSPGSSRHGASSRKGKNGRPARATGQEAASRKVGAMAAWSFARPERSTR
jgi:hypothetical protein